MPMTCLLRFLALPLLLISLAKAPAAFAAAADVSSDTATVKNAPTARRLEDKLHDVPSVLDYGVVCDTVVLRWRQVSIAAGSTQLTVVDAWFQPGDVGKLIVVAGAGAGGDNLAGKIARVESKSQVVLSSPAQAAVNVHNGYVAYGSDSAPALNAIFAGTSLPQWDLGEVRLPRGICGVGSTIVLPGGRDKGAFGLEQVTLRGGGRGVSWLVALAPMRAVIQEPAGAHNQANLIDFGIDGSGLADFGADIQGGRGGRHSGLYYDDNRIAGLHLGVVAVNPDGTLASPRGWYTNIWEFMVDHSTISADTTSVMPHGAPLFGILNSAGDSHFTDLVVAHASVANVRDTGSAHNFYTDVHAWGQPRYEFWVRGKAQFANCEVDGAAEAGVRSDDDGLVWSGGAMISLNKGAPVGFFFPSASGHHAIVGPDIQDIPPNSYVRLGPGVQLHDSIIQIQGLGGAK
ncbi:MAG TPA: hypothetical protein VKY22_11845 [Bradyrhizobium sp.]|nr:hypothetical protein [Bradyrhizobium sp.]